jgi:hypothetical protein
MQFNRCSKLLQSETININTAISLIESLLLYIRSLRDAFERYETIAKEKSATKEYKCTFSREKKRSSRISFFDGNCEETTFSGSENFRIQTFLPILDALIVALSKRGEAYKEIHNRFIFFHNIINLSYNEIDLFSSRLCTCYPLDLDKTEFNAECLHLKQYILTWQTDGCVDIFQLYGKIATDKLETVFPYVEIALRIFLCMFVTNASTERSFSKLKMVKSESRNSMLQARLNYLSIMTIENDVVSGIDFSDIISQFSDRKSRKSSFC